MSRTFWDTFFLVETALLIVLVCMRRLLSNFLIGQHVVTVFRFAGGCIPTRFCIDGSKTVSLVEPCLRAVILVSRGI
ncbi:hypothetical protein GGQ77_000881 [Geobacillus thermodenitrificans]|nr:hypothetical protein [Geobacillus thermodenitrificans]